MRYGSLLSRAKSRCAKTKRIPLASKKRLKAWLSAMLRN